MSILHNSQHSQLISRLEAADFIVARLTVLVTTSGTIGLAVTRALLGLKMPASALCVRVAVRCVFVCVCVCVCVVWFA